MSNLRILVKADGTPYDLRLNGDYADTVNEVLREAADKDAEILKKSIDLMPREFFINLPIAVEFGLGFCFIALTTTWAFIISWRVLLWLGWVK